MIASDNLLIRLAVALLAGLSVGIEREWSAHEQNRSRFAGVRTFALLGLLGGLAAELGNQGLVGAAAALVAGGAALVAIAYAATALRGDVDGTTEIAALVVLGAGVFAGLGLLAIAAGLSAIMVLVLIEKSRIHSAVYRIRSQELEAAGRFGVLALVVLPLLPIGPYGPEPGFRPRELWALVLIFSGLSFAGYIALRLAGPDRGYSVAGLLGGLISSTAVSLAFSRESRSHPRLGRALGLGVVAACTVLLVRTAFLATILNRAVGFAVIPYLILPLIAGTITVLVTYRRRDREHAGGLPEQPSPLRLTAAIQMAVAFQAVVYILHWISDRFGSPAVLVSAAILGLTDVDALTFSMAKLVSASGDVPTAAQGLMIGIISNTCLKLAVVISVGQGRFRNIAGAGLAGLALTAVASLLAI